jgi:hypothetical protein
MIYAMDGGRIPSIHVLTSHRQTRRQVSRALCAGGIVPHFVDRTEDLAGVQSDLIILDCDNTDPKVMDAVLAGISRSRHPAPVIILSVGSDKGPLIELIQRYDIGNLVAKHGAIRAVFPVLDERELLVTCNKVFQRDIFGIDKYVASWGVVLHHTVITGMADKVPFLNQFETYLTELDCPQSVVPSIVTVAEELILNAVVHAPRHENGEPKYEEIGPYPELMLEPHEYVDVSYGCDGQRLMLSVTDNFGRLNKDTLYNYLARGFDQTQMEAESKPGGAGLGLSLSFRSIHQLIFNIQESLRTEVIAGWYLRVSTASEFRQVGKSLNLFWLPQHSQPVEADPLAVRLSGRLDESTDLSVAATAREIDLRNVTSISSRGLLHWLKFIRTMRNKRLAVRGCPEHLVRLATEVAGVLQGVEIRTVLVPYECSACGLETVFEQAPVNALSFLEINCSACGQRMRFAGVPEQYQTFCENHDIAG